VGWVTGAASMLGLLIGTCQGALNMIALLLLAIISRKARPVWSPRVVRRVDAMTPGQ